MRTVVTLKWLIRGVLAILAIFWLVFGLSWTWHYVRGGRARAEAYVMHVAMIGGYTLGDESGPDLSPSVGKAADRPSGSIDPLIQEIHATYEVLIAYLLITWLLVEVQRLLTRIESRRSRGPSPSA